MQKYEHASKDISNHIFKAMKRHDLNYFEVIGIMGSIISYMSLQMDLTLKNQPKDDIPEQ